VRVRVHEAGHRQHPARIDYLLEMAGIGSPGGLHGLNLTAAYQYILLPQHIGAGRIRRAPQDEAVLN